MKVCPDLPRCSNNMLSLPMGAQHPWLAPMAGYTDLPFRLLCRSYGAAVCVTEMVSAKGLVYGSPGTGELLRTLPEDQPLVVQLFGREASFLAQAVRLLRQAGYGWFDFNVGCSVHKVLRQGAGAALLGDRETLLAAVSAMLKVAGPGRLGVKLRLGLDAAHPVLPDLALRLEERGVGWLTLHPRTARDGFGGRAQWEMLARTASRLTIPLLASGDLFTADDGLRCLRETGATGLMYARGALHDPAIFAKHTAWLCGDRPSASDAASVKGMIQRHVSLIRAYGRTESALWQLRSVIPRYVRCLPGARALRQALCRCTDWATLEEILETFF